jgi:hypothetical protein
MTFMVFGGLFDNVTRISILGTYVLSELNSGKTLKLGKCEASFIKKRINIK